MFHNLNKSLIKGVSTTSISGNFARNCFSSKLATILVGYPLIFLHLAGNIVTLEREYHYKLLENHFLANISGNTCSGIPPLKRIDRQ